MSTTISLENYELFAIDYVEGTLPAQTRREMEAFLATRPELRLALEELEGFRLPEEALPSFPNKAALYRPMAKGKRRVAAWRWWSGGGLVVALSVGLLYATQYVALPPTFVFERGATMPAAVRQALITLQNVDAPQPQTEATADNLTPASATQGAQQPLPAPKALAIAPPRKEEQPIAAQAPTGTPAIVPETATAPLAEVISPIVAVTTLEAVQAKGLNALTVATPIEERTPVRSLKPVVSKITKRKGLNLKIKFKKPKPAPREFARQVFAAVVPDTWANTKIEFRFQNGSTRQ